MTQEMIFEKLADIILVNFSIPKEHITMDASFRANLGMDSLDLVDLIFFINRNFQIDESVEAYHELATVDDLVAFIQNKSSKPKA